MFEVTLGRLEGIATAQIAIAAAIVAEETVKTVVTIGATSPLLVLATHALEAATTALAIEVAAMAAVQGSRAASLAALATVGGLSAQSAGTNAALAAAVAGTA